MAERLKRIGTGTILLPNRPGIAQTAAIVGKKEGSGPLHSEFDAVIEDDLFGEETWEKAESRFHYTAADTCLKKAGATPESVDVTLGGDLLNQIMAASTAAQKLQTPFLGIYGACSTMAETLCIGAMLCDGGYARRALCCASSHFCSAERQYRFPLEYGNQRPPTSQWTVTGAGAALLDAAVDGTEVVKADTIEELAALMGVDADTLVKSVETYNTACATGNDTEFGKDASNLTAIDAAPYYAVRIYVCTGGTIAGVKTNLDFQVLREDGSVINGLYAGGETSNREMYAYAYSSGSGVGYALASGRQIGMNLMK
mgnify:FL=1